MSPLEINEKSDSTGPNARDEDKGTGPYYWEGCGVWVEFGDTAIPTSSTGWL